MCTVHTAISVTVPRRNQFVRYFSYIIVFRVLYHELSRYALYSIVHLQSMLDYPDIS